MEKNNSSFDEFIGGSSQFAGGMEDIVKATFNFIDPLVKSAEGLVKLLKLLP